jgi:hypothetical protein
VAKLAFKIRRMESGETQVAEFDSAEDARKWLQARPPFVEVLRMVTSVSPEVEEDLRGAMRPLDAQERARQMQLEAEVEARRAVEMSRLRGDAAAEDTDPDRVMAIRWERIKGMALADDNDDREIPDVVRDAVLAWVEERDSWVYDRGEHVAAASLAVWPAAVPGGSEADRVQPGGQFVTGKRPPAN